MLNCLLEISENKGWVIMGEKKLKEEIITIEELIESKRFDSLKEIYSIPDSVLPRVRRAGKIVRPLRFYVKDVERLFSKPKSDDRVSHVQITQLESLPRPTIQFKKRRR